MIPLICSQEEEGRGKGERRRQEGEGNWMEKGVSRKERGKEKGIGGEGQK